MAGHPRRTAWSRPELICPDLLCPRWFALERRRLDGRREIGDLLADREGGRSESESLPGALVNRRCGESAPRFDQSARPLPGPFAVPNAVRVLAAVRTSDSRGVTQHGIVAADRNRHQVTKVAKQLLGQSTGIHARIDALIHLRQRRGSVTIGERFGQRVESLVIGGAEHRVDLSGVQLSIAEAEHLLEQRLAVSHRAGSASGDQFQCRIVRLGRLGIDDEAKPLHDFLQLHRCEVKSLASAQHGDRDLFRIGRAEDELHMLGRFFERLEQCVEGRLASACGLHR